MLTNRASQLRVLLLAFLAGLPCAGGAGAQLCPPREGVELPPFALALQREDRSAYRMERAWNARREAAVAALRSSNGEFAKSGPESAVSGMLRAPIFLLMYADTPSAVYPSDRMEKLLFGEKRSLRDFYREMSRGLLDVGGQVFDWHPLRQPGEYYEGESSGTRPGDARTGELIYETLLAHDAGVDFGQYDNDGPDGIPNSGDDDGYVDFVAFVHPESGGECDGSGNMWSHRWRYSVWPRSQGQPYLTDDPSANGGPILVDDYTLQPALSCDPSIGVEMGIFCHEFGHVFGLPDLYDLDGGGEGLGHWGLMASGNWNEPASPAHMSAWSKQQLGWVDTKIVDWRGADLWIDGVLQSGTVYEIPYREDRWRRREDAAIRGSASLAVGLDAEEAEARGWSKPGYGNGWHETVAHDFASDGSGPVSLRFDYRIECERVFDFGFVILEMEGVETTLAALDGSEEGSLEFDLGGLLGDTPAEFRIKFRFRSDHYYSTEDGRHKLGVAPFVVDDVELSGGSIEHRSDFETHVNGWYSPTGQLDNPVHERWLLENRASTGYDRNLPGEGLLIYHVDDQVLQTSLGNRGTDGRTRGLVVEEADGRGDLLSLAGGRGDAGDVWPGSSDALVFDQFSTPSTISNSGRPSGVSVRILGQSGSSLHCRLDGGAPAPQLRAVSATTAGDLRIDVLDGSNLRHGVQLRLLAPEVPARTASSVEWLDQDRVSARFDLSDLPAGSYALLVENPDGQTTVLEDAVELEGQATAILPTRLALRQNFPNPFNPRTTIRFELPRPSPTLLRIFDARGRSVRTLVDELLPAGSYDRIWDGRDDSATAAASGVYFYELRTGDERQIRKMLLLR